MSLFFDGAGGISAAVASVALALWEFMRLRPPLTPLGVAALGGSLLAPLAVGPSAWLSRAWLGLSGNVFVDAYGPAMGAAALGGVVAFLTVARGPLGRFCSVYLLRVFSRGVLRRSAAVSRQHAPNQHLDAGPGRLVSTLQ